MSITRNLYGTLATIISPIVIGGFTASERGKIKLAERCGNWPKVKGSPLWFHGASRGELQGLLPISRAIKTEETFFTTVSPSGLDFGNEAQLDPHLLPFDIPWCVSNALAKIAPRAFIFGETELWPWLLGELRKKELPIILVNGRISDYTFERYKKLSFLTKEALNNITRFCVSSENTKERFIELGAAPQKIVVTGNSKYDKDLILSSDEEKKALKLKLFKDEGKIVTLGSLRPGEEEYWFPVLREYLQEGSKIKILLAPRHKEQFDYFADKISKAQINFVRWSELEIKKDVARDLVLVDTFGELEKLYSISDLAFIGATLVNIGGHNPLEASAYGTHVVVGPYTANVSDIVVELADAGALSRISNLQDIKQIIDRLLQTDILKEMAENGRKIAARHRGATERVIQVLKDERIA